MTTAARVLDIARSQIGTRQAANGANKYGAAYGMDRVAWCNQFTWWVLREAGAGHLTPKSAYTPTTFNWYKQRGLTGTAPRVGALVFFNWGPPLNRISHIGFVEAINADGTITTIEGNTATGNDRMGGSVMRRVRRGAIVGYAYPQYAGAPAQPAPAPPSAPAPSGLRTLQYGMRNDQGVVGLQAFLNKFNWVPALPLLPKTGNYLDQTKAVVAAAQRQCGITGSDADGSIVGPRTKAAFQQRGAHWV